MGLLESENSIGRYQDEVMVYEVADLWGKGGGKHLIIFMAGESV